MMRLTMVAAALIAVPGGAAHAQGRSPETVTGNPATAFVRDAGPHSRSVDISLLAGTPGMFLVGFGGGGRIAFPMVHDGFIGSINNAVALETGAEFFHWGFLSFAYDTIAVPVQLRWSFFLTPEWTVFGSAGLSFNVFNFHDDGGFFQAPEGVDFFTFGNGGVITTAFGFGALFHLSDSVSLRLDASANLLGVGLTFRL